MTVAIKEDSAPLGGRGGVVAVTSAGAEGQGKLDWVLSRAFGNKKGKQWLQVRVRSYNSLGKEYWLPRDPTNTALETSWGHYFHLTH